MKLKRELNRWHLSRQARLEAGRGLRSQASLKLQRKITRKKNGFIEEKKKIENKRNRKKEKEMKKELEEKSRKANYRRNPFFMIAISTSRKRKSTLSILIFVKHC